MFFYLFFNDFGAPSLEGALGTCLHCLLDNPALHLSHVLLMPLIYFTVSEALNEMKHKFNNMTSAFKTLEGNNNAAINNAAINSAAISNASLIRAITKLREELNKEPQIAKCKSIYLSLYYKPINCCNTS